MYEGLAFSQARLDWIGDMQYFCLLGWYRNYMNDSFRSNVFVRFTPETIACACIYLAARQLQLALPNNPPWFSLFLVVESDIVAICMEIMQLYKRKKPNADELERTVNEVKKIHIEAKLKAKGISSEFGTPISTSRPSSPSKISPSPLTLAGRKMKLEDDTSDGSHSGYNHVSKKKRSYSRSRSVTRSKSRSSSRSRSRSPSNKRRYRSSPKKYKKESRYNKDKRRDRDYKHSHKRRRSLSYSPDAYHSPERSHSHHRKYKDTKAERDRYRSRSRSRSPARDKHRSRKHNGHHNHTSRDMYRR